MISFIKVEIMAELLHYITVECTGVPNEVAGRCIYTIKGSF